MKKLKEELQEFIDVAQQCAERGPPPAKPQDTPREVDAAYRMCKPGYSTPKRLQVGYETTLTHTYSHQPWQGSFAGDIESTVNSIKAAVDEAELMAGCEISHVYAGIAGGHIMGFNSQDDSDFQQPIPGRLERPSRTAMCGIRSRAAARAVKPL